jgi:hypothetical protein
MSPFHNFIVIAGMALVTFALHRFVNDADTWAHFLGACVIWAGAMIASAHVFGLFRDKQSRFDKEAAPRALLSLFAVIVVPLVLLFALHYSGYLPAQKIVVYAVGTAVLVPMAQRTMWWLRGGQDGKGGHRVLTNRKKSERR